MLLASTHNVGAGGESAEPQGPDLRFGPLSLRVRPTEEFVFYATFIAGEWDALELRPGDVVIDAGANVGDFTVKAAREVGSEGKVIAVEPDPKLQPYLEHNIRVNKLSNTVVVHCALGEPGEGFLVPPSNGGSVGNYLSHAGSGQHVDVRSLDDIMTLAHVHEVNVIKMDIEGAEVDALSTFSRLRTVRQIAVELHGQDNLRDVPNLLKDQFEFSFQSRWDVWIRSGRHSLRHPLQLASNELRSHFIATRGIVSGTLGRRFPVPSVTGSSKLAILYARNKGRFPS